MSASRVEEDGCREGAMSRITEEYVTEKIEAYNVAIEALKHHEPASYCDEELAHGLRKRLWEKLDREIQKWCDENMHKARKK